MRRSILVFLFMTALLSSSESVAAQDVYYVQSVKARIMSVPSFRAKVLGEASKGTKLVSSGRQGNWIMVTFYKQQGYVPSLLLSKYPPVEKLSVIKGDETDIKRSVRRRASTYTSAAAARGLAQDDRRRLSGEEKVDYGGLEKMESVMVDSEEIMRFMEGGKL